ncbi:MAG TPA: nickel pincer cofactor biosynthesis protein LarC, partial [Chloroflexota bacterium]|nr:nickel pincer cofactor biosynthesis protein LarC [Chloroflexota bacterium]
GVTVAAYFECFSGASGDMILGALLDAGWPEAAFREALAGVPLGDWEADVRRVKKGALHATQVTIRVTAPQPERDVRDILPVIAASGLPEAVKARASALFLELADVEGLEHGQPPETVHFHEVGAVDSILDIVGACAGLHALGIERLYVSPINVGGGTVPTRDGILPVPGPAALELLRRKGAPLYASEYGPEFLTPTGALILATLADGFGPFPPMRVERVGYGAGQKDFTVPNVLRVSVGTLYAGWRRYGAGRAGLPAAPAPATHDHAHAGGDHAHAGGDHAHAGHDHAGPPAAEQEDVVVQLETNVDDMNPEWYGHLGERLLAEGALDVTLIPALMKKGRPGTLVSVLVRPEGVEPALGTLFAETTTLGVRIREVARRTLDRRVVAVETPYGRVRVKLGLLDGAVRSAAPEYEDCRAAARRADVPLRRVYEAASRAAEDATGGG